MQTLPTIDCIVDCSAKGLFPDIHQARQEFWFSRALGVPKVELIAGHRERHLHLPDTARQGLCGASAGVAKGLGSA